MNYYLHLLIYLCIYSIVAMSLNLVVGYCGLLVLSHAGYFALGGYVYALATLKLGWGFLPSMALGMGVAAILSLAVSLASWRFRDDFFVLITLAVQAVLFSLYSNWFSSSEPPGTWTNLTNGPFGLADISKPVIWGSELKTTWEITVFSCFWAGLCGFLCHVLLSSPWARLLKAIRDDELATRGLGKGVRLAKVQVIAISCAMVSVAGAIYASYVGYLEPSTASLSEGILLLSMVIVGGVGNFRGPLVGAIIVLILPEILCLVDIPDAIAANIRLLLYGFLLVLMMHYRPQGVAGEYRIE